MNDILRRLNRRFLLLLWVLGALGGSTASAVTPGQIPFQGILRDASGAPLVGAVDMDFSLYPSPTDPIALWSESHPAVPLTNGVYEVVLGTTTPITPTLLGGSAEIYLQIVVETETLAPRQRLLAVPFAIEAENAATAGVALSLFGTQGTIIDQIFANGVSGSSGLLNSDPREGLADPDGDGIANFVDPDNDNDLILDQNEIGASDMNLPTPLIQADSPQEASVTSTVGVLGSSLEIGMTVTLDGVPFAATNLDLTPPGLLGQSFEIVVPPRSPGSAILEVTRTNGERAVGTVDFIENAPIITLVSPPAGLSTVASTVVVSGTGFFPGLKLSVDGGPPIDLDPVSRTFSFVAGPGLPAVLPITVSYPSGMSDLASFELLDAAAVKTVFVTSTKSAGALGGIAGADADCGLLAMQAGLTGIYQTWISDDTVSPQSRFSQVGPWVRTDGAVVALNWVDLTGGSLLVPIDIDETGAQVPASSAVWTNTSLGPVRPASATATCQNWASGTAADTARVGLADLSTNSLWTDVGGFFPDATCDSLARLYCFEQ